MDGLKGLNVQGLAFNDLGKGLFLLRSKVVPL